MSIVGIDEIRKEFEPFLQPDGRLLEVAGAPRDVGERRKRVRAQPDVAEPLCDRVHTARGRLILPPQRNGGERLRMGWGAFFGKLDRTIDPLVDDHSIGWSLPHAGPPRCLQRKLRVEVPRRTHEVYCLLDRRTEGLAIESERVCATDLYPEFGLFLSVGFEGGSSVQQCDSVFDLIASDRKRCRALRQFDSLRA